MRLFETVTVENLGGYATIVPGMDIYAMNEDHARAALKHHGEALAIITDSIALQSTKINRVVMIDSLLVPSLLQQN